MIEYLSRREFIGKSALMAGGALGSLAMARNVVSSEDPPAAKIKFLENRCNIETQQPKILVTYASRCGSTGGVAGAIAGTFCDNGASVDVLRIESVSDLSPYHAVIVGSAIRSDRWLPEAIEFVEEHRTSLSRIPVAYFLTCLTLVNATLETRQKALGFMAPLRESVAEITPVGTGLFAGTLNYDKLPFMVRMVMKIRMQSTGVVEGDYRNWKSIRAWAREIAPAMGA